MNGFRLLLVFIFCCSGALAQPPEVKIYWLTDIPDKANVILYNPKQKLAIEDFAGVPDLDNDAVAITSSGLMFTAGYRSKGNQATLSVGVYCSFSKKESWMKGKGKNPYILEHEQRHFDISYLYTLMFIQKLQQVKFRKDGYMDQLKEVYQQSVEKMEAFQQQYDSETQNGINKEKQAAWNGRIRQKLKEAATEPLL